MQCKECWCLCLSEISSASLPPHCPIRPLSELSDNNITIGHFCAETGLGSISNTLALTIPDSREEFCTAEHQYSYSILIWGLPSVRTRLQRTVKARSSRPQPSLPYFVWNNLIIGECVVEPGPGPGRAGRPVDIISSRSLYSPLFDH